MGLTRLRAEQISDIDYKQAVRVITVTNVTLSGGAPNQVDGVNLSVSDRILVTGQNTGSQNGIYQVQTLGTGSNGTWIRSTDTNATGELEAGTIVMVTEGNIYKDTQWKLTTNNPIVIGTTALTFEQNSAFAFGNVFANGTAVLANTVGDVLTLTAGNNIQITGNNTAKSVTIAVTGISLNSISNGTSNVNVVSSGGNITVGVGGTANVAEFSTGGLRVTGFASASGNITGGNLLTVGLISSTGNIQSGNLRTAGLVTATGNVDAGNLRTAGLVSATGNVDAGNLRTAGLITATGNITGGNITTEGLITVTGNITSGNVLTAGLVSATGNITGNFINGNGSALTGINAFSNITVSGGNSIIADSISDTLTITAGSGISIVADSANDTITIASAGSGDSIFATGGDMGTVTETVTASEDLGLVTEVPATTFYDLGSVIDATGLIYPSQLVLPTYTSGTLPAAAPAAQFIYLSSSSIGPMTAFSDGTNWRFTSSGNIVS